jgi:hypothetical protein
VIEAESGDATPSGNSVTYPRPEGETVVMLTETALAVAGMPQTPATSKTRLAPEAMAVLDRVSTSRHGVTV